LAISTFRHRKVTLNIFDGAGNRGLNERVNKTFIVETKYGGIEWNLNSECREVVTPIAQEFGMGVEQFLTLYTRGRLPAQPVLGNDVDEDRPPPGFAITDPKDRSTWNRVRKAARFEGKPSKSFAGGQ